MSVNKHERSEAPVVIRRTSLGHNVFVRGAEGRHSPLLLPLHHITKNILRVVGFVIVVLVEPLWSGQWPDTCSTPGRFSN